MTAAGRDGREQLVDFAILLEKGLWGSWGQAHRDQIASFVEASLDELVNTQTADVNAEVTDVNEPQWDDAAVLQDVAEKVILSTSQRRHSTPSTLFVLAVSTLGWGPATSGPLVAAGLVWGPRIFSVAP